MIKRFSLLFLALILFLPFLHSCASPSLETIKEPKETIEEGQETKNQEQAPKEQKDPSMDSTLNVLIIGNSDSTGWPDELNGVLSAAGIKANIFTVYYSGCTPVMHWNWLQGGQKFYRLRHHVQGGGIGDNEPVNLEFCLKQRNWDVISLQGEFTSSTGPGFDEEAFRTRHSACVKNLYDYIRERFPKTRLVWFETWAYEVGWSRNDRAVKTLEDQNKMYQLMNSFAISMATENNVPIVPCGTAFQIARVTPGSDGNLCRDGYHDGPEAGGQYLNACVWFECLTKQSCIGNTWRPNYELAEERILALQQVAHKAVEQNQYKEAKL